MADSPKPNLVPPPNPRVLHPEPSKPKLMLIGGWAGLIMWLLTAATVVIVGTMAWGRYGTAFRKVFERNISTSYTSRKAFLESRLTEVEKADASRRFGIFSPWLPKHESGRPRALLVYMEGDALVLDASDARGDEAAQGAAKDLAVLALPGAEPAAFRVKFAPPRKASQIADAADSMLQALLDAPPEGGANDVLRFDDVPDPEKK